MDTIRTLVDAVHAHARAVPDKLAFRFEGRDTDFASFDAATDRVALALAGAGVKPGARVAYIGKNSDRYFEALYGSMKAGVVMVPVNWRLAGPEMVAIVNDSQARILLVGPEFLALAGDSLADMPAVDLVLAAEGGHATWPDFAA